jgi:hypothetical protein
MFFYRIKLISMHYSRCIWFRHTLLLVFIFLICSCGQKSQTKAVPTPNDTNVLPPASSTADTATIRADTEPSKTVPDADRQHIDLLPEALTSFVPQGYAALDTTSGDLNLDEYPDMILVLKKKDEALTSDVSEHPEKRPLLILTGGAGQTYTLAARSDNAVYCIDCGGVLGDPFTGVVISKGYFSVEHYGGSSWRWTRTITFKYVPTEKDWYLHKDGGDSFHASEPEQVTTKVRTTKDFGKVPFSSFDVYREQ